MSQSWPEVPIKEVYWGLFDGPHATPPVSEGGPVFLGIGNVTEDGHIDLTGVKHISESDFPKWTKRVTPKAGDIVFTYEATLNRYAIVPHGFRGCLGRRMALIRPNPQKIDTRFLHYSFFGPAWRATIEANRLSGATVDRIPLTKFPNFPIRLPPLPTQRKIAAILSAYDDLIENNTRRVQVLEDMARALYREWFVEYRFPGHEQAEWVEDEAGRRPKGWDIVPVPLAIELDPKTKVDKNGVNPFVPMTSLSENSMVIAPIEEKAGNSGAKFKNGDTLFARITPCLENGKTGFVAFLPNDETTAFGSTEYIVMRSRRVCPEYVYLLARQPEFRDHAQKSMSGASGRQRVKSDCFNTYFIAVPDKKILDRFQEVTVPMFAQIFNLSQRNANFRRTRDLLLPRLVSGELDVSGLRVLGLGLEGEIDVGGMEGGEG